MTSLRKKKDEEQRCMAQAALLLFTSTSFPKSLFKQMMSAYDLSKKDAIIWGLNNESVAKAKYCTFGDAVVEETGIYKVMFVFSSALCYCTAELLLSCERLLSVRRLLNPFYLLFNPNYTFNRERRTQPCQLRGHLRHTNLQMLQMNGYL